MAPKKKAAAKQSPAAKPSPGGGGGGGGGAGAGAGEGDGEARLDPKDVNEARVREGLRQLRELAPRAPWSAESDGALLALSPGAGRDRGGESLGGLLGELTAQGAVGISTLQDLCMTLRGGGYETAEAACGGGALEVTLELLAPAKRGGGAPLSAQAPPPADMRALAAEALWLMIYDHESSQRLIDAGGHRRLLGLLRDEGASSGAEGAAGAAGLRRGTLRVVGETLYSEPRSAELWRSGELALLVEALDWALRFEPSAERGAVLALVCNLAALWVWRARGPAVEALLPLVALVPRLLQELSVRGDEPELLQQASRLLHGLAARSRYWPENVREPTIAAMKAMSSEYQFSPLPGGNGFQVQALKAVKSLPPGDGPGLLSTMD